MNRTQIMSKLSKLIKVQKGEQLHYEHRIGAPDAEERAKMRQRYLAAKEDREAARKRRDARAAALQAADPEWKALNEEMLAASKRVQANASHTRPAIQVGVLHSIAGFGVFSISASGDTWPEVFDKLAKK